MNWIIMKRLLIIALVFLLPSAIAEMSHSPKELSEGETFSAWIDAEDDVKAITFYVCTLEDPHTCYKPEKMDRNDSTNGRFEFNYDCLLYTSPSPRDRQKSRMPSSA